MPRSRRPRSACSGCDPDAVAVEPARRIRNVGPVSQRWLAAVGIHDLDDLGQIGVVDACRLLRAHGYNVTLNMAWALAGALLDCDWRDVPEDVRRDLRARIGRQP
jgi:DNA transformation protein